MPELLDGKRPEFIGSLSMKRSSAKAIQSVADGLKLAHRGAGEKLTPKQVRTQQLIGSEKFIERVHPRASLLLHRLSCVMSSPPPEAYDIARVVLLLMWDERETGITFGGGGLTASPRLEGALGACIDLSEPAPAELIAHADATWGDRNVYGLIITYAGAAILHAVKKISMIVDSSMEAESIGTSKAGESIAYAREILRAFGVPPAGPTIITTDNSSNQSVASGVGCPTRSKHFLRRYHVLRQRIRSAEVELRHVPDEEMPADFLTKWIPRKKLDISVRYATNSHGTISASA